MLAWWREARFKLRRGEHDGADLNDAVNRANVELAALRSGQAALSAAVERMEAGLAELEQTQNHATIETLVGLVLAALDGDVDGLVEPSSLLSTETHRTILRNYRVLRALEWQAARRAVKNDSKGVLNISHAAGDWACFHHPGVFVSETLERLLWETGRRILADLPIYKIGQMSPRRVLHVMTAAHPVGGHTRLADRWMRFDGSSQHSVVLTGQGDVPVPDWLAESAGGRLRQLQEADSGARVRELNELMSRFDTVVLHIHPYDVISVAACADPDRRPGTIFVNHGDHVFWLGVGAADAVVNIRPSGASLAVERRSISADRCFTIPVPLDPVTRSATRDEAKDVLGLPSGAVLLVTMASAMKYAIGGDVSFVGLAADVLSRRPDLHLMAVGPEPRSPGWGGLIDRLPGRVHVLGPRTDVRTILEAADIYLDSFPFASLTSLLEASLYCTPIVSYRPPGAGALAADDVDVTLPVVTTPEAWCSAVIRLADDAEHRHSVGRELAKAVSTVHLAPAWRAYLPDLYRAAGDARAAVGSSPRPQVTDFDLALHRFQELSRIGRPPEVLLASYGLLPRYFA